MASVRPSPLSSDELAYIRATDAAVGDDENLQGCPSAWAERRALLRHIDAITDAEQAPVPMLLWCPGCHQRHVDEGQYAEQAHHTHACQYCGMVWRPALAATVGVHFLPGFKNPEPEDTCPRCQGTGETPHGHECLDPWHRGRS